MENNQNKLNYLVKIYLDYIVDSCLMWFIVFNCFTTAIERYDNNIAILVWRTEFAKMSFHLIDY